MWPVYDGLAPIGQENKGNQEFLIYVEDNGESDTGADKLWFTVLFDGVPLDAQITLDTGSGDNTGNNVIDSGEAIMIEGGNIVVPQIPKKRSGKN